LKHYASILLAGYTLLACALAAQEPQRSSNDGKQFLVNTIALLSVPEKPISVKISIELTHTLGDGKTAQLHTEKVLARDNQGRIYEERRSSVPFNSDQSPQLEEIDLYDPAAKTVPLCVLSTKHCIIARYTPPPTFN
jgi:hypothetical protein